MAVGVVRQPQYPKPPSLGSCKEKLLPGGGGGVGCEAKEARGRGSKEPDGIGKKQKQIEILNVDQK